ncbi:uncharacterized protein LOC133930132 [Phragmites australis]|uniref:uncharacterized protein LOC133930132 n=1 Tax=Phragmites australis TaxID=29695 RepID=UPI002D76A917|nr:uncharacterized protein LOC133930132 [Phragmites australis]
MITRLRKAAILRFLVLEVLLMSPSARAQIVVLPNCNLQEVNLAPCMASGAATSGAGGNISNACCTLLNRAIDAGHRCVCSLLLSNGVFASLVTNLLTLPLMLTLPGCFLYAPSLAACQATLQQQTNAPPAAASAVSSAEGAAAGAVLPSPPQANATPPGKKSTDQEKADDWRMDASIGNGTSEAPSAVESEHQNSESKD